MEIWPVLIFVGDARKRKGVVDGSTVIAKLLPKLARDADAAKGRAVASEQGLNLLWEGFADGFEADRVVFAAVVKRDRARTASLLVCCGALLKPVCGAAAFAVLISLINAS